MFSSAAPVSEYTSRVLELPDIFSRGNRTTTAACYFSAEVMRLATCLFCCQSICLLGLSVEDMIIRVSNVRIFNMWIWYRSISQW